jgi:CheY-like chemotaxis protein
MESDKSFSQDNVPVRILLADNDEDDQFFFDDVLAKFDFAKQVSIVDDGERLLTYLLMPEQALPDVLFLDYNLPRKNGEECLIAIKQHAALKNIPVVMYSTYLQDEVADRLYTIGAHFFVRKTDSRSLEKILQTVLVRLLLKKSPRPQRDGFIITA